MKKEKPLREKEHIKDLISRMANEIGIHLSQEDLPKITHKGNQASYDPLDKTINIPLEYIESGLVLGEEITHFLRDYVQGEKRKKEQRINLKTYLLNSLGFNPRIKPTPPTKRDRHSEEFFGYLGRRIMKNITTSKDKLQFKNTSYSRKRAMNDLKNTSKRESVLVHQRPYEFAEAIDLKKIDYSKLLDLSDKEIRYRFFRQDPQYNLSKPPTEAKVTKRNPSKKTLEAKLAITSLALLLIILNPKITGFTITQNSPLLQSILIPSIFITTLILIYRTLKSSKKL